jgi:Putative zinc-finger
MNDLQIAAYIDRGLSGTERDQIEAHLAECAECRRHVLDTDELIRRVRRPKRLVIGSALVAAAAALIIVAVPSLRRSDGTLENPLYRDVPASSSLIAYGPTGESRVGSLRFVWSPAQGAMSYRLTVSRADGATLWTQSGRDTVAALPTSVTLHVGDRYFWVSDALLADGGSRSTGLREFTPIR